MMQRNNPNRYYITKSRADKDLVELMGRGAALTRLELKRLAKHRDGIKAHRDSLARAIKEFKANAGALAKMRRTSLAVKLAPKLAKKGARAEQQAFSDLDQAHMYRVEALEVYNDYLSLIETRVRRAETALRTKKS